ncbi:hypothetical protein ACEPUM_10390, partial [Pseudomonas aeruginosa]
RAALAQPSPAPELAERGTQHRFSTTEQTCRHDFAGVWWNDNGETKTGRECRHCGFFVADVTKAQAEQAEAERLDWSSALLDVAVLQEALTSRDSDERMKNMDAGEVIRRAFGKLKEIRAQHERIVGELRAENERLANDRDRANQFANGAALEINAALARVEQQERTIAGMNEAHAKLAGLYEAAQAQHSVPEGWMLVECGIWTQEQVDEMQKTVARFRSSEFVDDRALAMAVADAGQCKAPEISLADLLAAAPGKEGL